MPTQHVFHSIYLHFIWRCQGGQPLIDEKWEGLLYEFIQENCRQLDGVYFQAIGGTETHLHLVVEMEPSLSPSDLIGKIKGASSFEINRTLGDGTLKWQRGFGVVSFAKRNLPSVVRYVNNQKLHHSHGALNEVLERVE